MALGKGLQESVVLGFCLENLWTNKYGIHDISSREAMHEFAASLNEKKLFFSTKRRLLLQLQKSLDFGVLRTGYDILCLHSAYKSTQIHKANKEIFAFF
jgi:hypothetical protein